MLRRVLICSAFATWCFLNTWVELAEHDGSYFARYSPLRAVVAPVVGWEILITVGMLAAWELWRKRPARRTIGHFVFLFACFAPIGIASVATLRVLPFYTSVVRNWLFWPVVLVIGAGPAVFAVRRPVTASRWLRGMFLYSWPVLAIVLLQAGRATLRFAATVYDDGPRAVAFHSAPKGVRAVWIIFDELSQEITFENRPASLKLPNFDRLSRENFHAAAARSPSTATELSLPALIIGEHVRAATHEAPNRLLLTVEGHARPVEWSHAPNLFDSTRRMGYDTALAGWYLPYGRQLNRSLTRCDWTAGWLHSGVEEPTQPPSLFASLWERARLQFITLPLVGHLPGIDPGRYHREAKRERFAYLLERAREIGNGSRHRTCPHSSAGSASARHLQPFHAPVYGNRSGGLPGQRRPCGRNARRVAPCDGSGRAVGPDGASGQLRSWLAHESLAWRPRLDRRRGGRIRRRDTGRSVSLEDAGPVGGNQLRPALRHRAERTADHRDSGRGPHGSDAYRRCDCQPEAYSLASECA